jgi:hypothetical protein
MARGGSALSAIGVLRLVEIFPKRELADDNHLTDYFSHKIEEKVW